ncbi:MAG: hypothetical protein ACTSVO_04525 [Candidatus Heimdallarchaeaceae archaeon]
MLKEERVEEKGFLPEQEGNSYSTLLGFWLGFWQTEFLLIPD